MLGSSLASAHLSALRRGTLWSLSSLGSLAKCDLGKAVRRKECLQLDRSQGGVHGDLEG